MNYRIAHEIPGRIRLACGRASFSKDEASVIEYLLEAQEGVSNVNATAITGSILVTFAPGLDTRARILTAVRVIDREYLDGESLPAKYVEQSIVASGAVLLARNLVNRLLPMVVRGVINTIRFVPYLASALRSLVKGRLDVSILDASAIGVSLFFRDFSTAGTIMCLLAFGDILESWTRARSKRDLAAGLALKTDFLWIERDGAEVRIPASEISIGDVVVVRAGSVIPADGTVVRGEATVNESTMTGESVGVHRYPGTSVYAGTAIEEGELFISVTAFDNGTRLSRIVQMIDESENLKADVQSKAERVADNIVPYSFLMAGLVYLATRNFRKATSVLLVDYSCAIKLSTPLAILSAMKEAARHGVVTKGGRILEKIATADTVVFDKTGTLSVATPTVAEVVSFGKYSRKEILRTSACLEEHFPHSIARAVVQKALDEHLDHREEHAKVEYTVAHGIASSLAGQRVIIGSAHFVLEDEHIPISLENRRVIEDLAAHYSLLYLAIGGELAGVLCIEDPMRPEAARVVRELRATGIKRIVMLTGDGARSAEHAAESLGIDTYEARMLPAQKTEYIQRLRDEGACVIMVGDGINDSPALSVADVGIAMKDSADIAREISDVILTQGNLDSIVTVRKISKGVMRRIGENYGFIVAVNTALLALGLGGVIAPSTSALLHNASTIGASVHSLRPLLKD